MRSSIAHAADQIAFGILVAALALASFPVASNRDALVGVTSTLLIFAVFLCALARFGGFQPRQEHQRAPLSSNAGAVPASLAWLALLGLVVAWVWIGPALVNYPGLDLQRAEVYQAKALAYWCTAALVILTVHSSKRLLFLLSAIVAGATVQALIAIFSLSAGAHFTLLGVPFFALNRATGTFPNPDHFANYMAMSMALGIGLMLATSQPAQRTLKGWRGKVLSLLNFIMSTRMLVRLAVVIMVIGLVLSRSRMGNASFLLGLLLLLGTVAVVWPSKRAGALWLGASLLVIDVVVVGQWVGLDRVVERLQQTELAADTTQEPLYGASVRREESIEERLAIGQDAFKLAMQSPWVGHGPASFYGLFPQVKRPELTLWFDHAHNDYAEIASDLGLPALIGLGGVVVLAIVKWAQLMRQSTPTQAKGAACGAGMAVFCMLLHAWVDFNLHIHANALLFTAVLALPFALSTLPIRLRHTSRRAN
jgi:O-antigen ligase